ncbi:MAG: hypothetical protein JXA77_05225 [Bacteroidales bacterium]|nr:hypothetical protein [Bacteroidales bacterium]MBN2820450.1 hypothetical protein [Bacteroidales bacterium]
MKNLFAFISALLLFSVLSSCDREDSFLIPENQDIPLLEKLKHSDTTYKIFTYTDNNLLFEEKSKFFYQKHVYNKSNQLIRKEWYTDASVYSSSSYVIEEAQQRTEWVSPDNTERDMYKTYEYNDAGELITIIMNRENHEPAKTEYSYNLNGQIEKESHYYQGELSSYSLYTYDNRGNVKKLEKYSIDSNGNEILSTSTEFDYDDKYNPYRAFSRLCQPGKYTNVNNIIKETYRIHFDPGPGVDNVQSTEFTYEYNDSGYPISQDGLIEFVYK